MILSVSELRKQYGKKVALDGVSFAVSEGEIVGLLGPNGAGKTTIVSIVLGVLEPSSGSVSIAGHDVLRERSRALQETNFAAIYAPLPGNLTVEQNLRVFGMLYSVKDLAARCNEVMAEFDVELFRTVKTGLLSSGEQARVALAKSLINRPRLLLLDEPTASLDPSTARDLRRQIQQDVRQRHTAVLWTTHNMHEAIEVCDRVLFLSKGRILLEGDPRTLPAAHDKADLEELFIAVAREPLSLETE